MENNKKFYWIKLRTDFFNLDEIDFLLSQKNGCEYIVLYQMLCLKTANNGGRLCMEIGEMMVPFDIEKIVRETKYFDFDTVAVALELFKKLGLVYEQNNNILKVAAIDEMVGSETSSAQRVRKHREKKALQCNTNVTKTMLQSNIEIDKEIDIDKDKEKEKEIETKPRKKAVPINYDFFSETYNSICTNLSKVTVLSEKRKGAVKKFLTVFKQEQFIEICKRANESAFLTGNNERGWTADFDFIIKPDKAIGILEGKYDFKNRVPVSNIPTESDYENDGYLIS